MDQRPLRLGDLVDDYCPRERRLTNHAVVALVGDEIRQTRCTTCDVEHVYKHARVPKRTTASKDAAADAALPDNGSGQLVPKAAGAEAVPESSAGRPEAADPAATDPPESDRPAKDGPEPPRDLDGWLAHRPLIRATLPRTEGDPPAPRPIPEFTMHRQTYGRAPRGHGRFGNGQPQNGFDPDRHGNYASSGNHNQNHGNPGNGQRPPGGGGRRRRRRGGRHKPSH
jgi:hypothetical protein